MLQDLIGFLDQSYKSMQGLERGRKVLRVLFFSLHHDSIADSVVNRCCRVGSVSASFPISVPALPSRLPPPPSLPSLSPERETKWSE